MSTHSLAINLGLSRPILRANDEARKIIRCISMTTTTSAISTAPLRSWIRDHPSGARMTKGGHRKMSPSLHSVKFIRSAFSRSVRAKEASLSGSRRQCGANSSLSTPHRRWSRRVALSGSIRCWGTYATSHSRTIRSMPSSPPGCCITFPLCTKDWPKWREFFVRAGD